MKKKQRLVLASIAVFLSLTFIDETGVAVTLPATQAALGMGAVALQWVLNAFFLALALCVLPAGLAADKVGARRTFQLGMAVFAIASLGCALSWSGTVLIAARFCQGVGAAMMMATYAILISRAFPPERQGAALGTAASMAAFFLAAGPLIGGVIAELVNWRWIYVVNVPIGMLVMAMVQQGAPEDLERARFPRIKGWSTLAFSGGFGALIVALMEAPEWGWSDGRTLMCLVVSVVLMPVFYLLQLSPVHRMIDLKLFRSREFTVGNIVLLTTQVPVMCVAFWALWTQVALGMPPLIAGIALLPAGLPILFMGRIGGNWADRASPSAPIRMGTQLLIVSVLLFAFAAYIRNYPIAFVAMTIYAFGAPLVISPAIKLVMISTPDGKHGEAAGIFNTMRNLGAALAFGCVGAALIYVDRLGISKIAGKYEFLDLTIVKESQDIIIRGAADDSAQSSALLSVLYAEAANSYSAAMAVGMLVASIFALIGCCAAVGYLRQTPALVTKPASDTA